MYFVNIFSSNPTMFRRNQLISLCRKLNTKAKHFATNFLCAEIHTMLFKNFSFKISGINPTAFIQIIWMFQVKQNFVLAPKIYPCRGIVMSPFPTSPFIFILMLIFFSCDTFLETTSKFQVWLPNFFLPISSDIIFLLHSSSFSSIWLNVCIAWLYLKLKKPKLKHSSSSQLLFIDFPNIFSKCVMFIRDRRNTDLAETLVTAAPVTINSTLDNAEFLDPFLQYIFKNFIKLYIYFHHFLVVVFFL